MRSRSASSALSNPVLVGAVTLLVVFVAVFLAYNANNGLPFVPTTLLRVESPSGANIVRGNEVRSGGFRIGVVQDLEPAMLRGGHVGAILDLKLDKTIGAIPRDSTVAIRPRSALGLKYVELTTGRSKQTYRDGDTLPIEQTHIPVEIDEVFSTFDRPTREASQGNLLEFGNALSGRGPAIGETLEVLPALARSLEPVMKTLSDPRTDLPGFFRALDRTVRTLAPVSKTQARLFTTMADTFEAISRDPEALKSTISKSPPTLDVATESLRVQRPFLEDFADFSADLRGAADELRASLPTINDAVERGIGVQLRAVALNHQLRDTFKTLDEVAGAPGTNSGLRALTETVGTLNPTVRFVGPYITVCNGWNYFWTHNAEHFSEEDSTGHAQRALLNSAGRQDNSLAQMGATAPANGENVEPGETPQYLQGQPYGAAIGPDGRADCEFGQRGFLRRQAKYAPPKYQVANDPRTPGLQGPTPTGLPRVPEGETFTDKPQTGGYKDFPVSEFGGR